MKKLILTALLALIGTSTSFAGNSSGGGGGFTVTCGANNNVSVELADIWFAKNGRETFDSMPQQLIDVAPSDSVEMILNIVILRAISADKTMGNVLKEAINKMQSDVSYIREGDQLVLKNDTETISLPQGCKLKPVARYSDRFGMLFIDKSIYDRLDNLNKAALYVHEAVYYLRRNGYGHDETSYVSQLIVGYIFSQNHKLGMNEEILSRVESPMLCQGEYFDNQDNDFGDYYTHKRPSSYIMGIINGELRAWVFANSPGYKDFDVVPYLSKKLYPHSFDNHKYPNMTEGEYLVNIYREAVRKNKVNEFVLHSHTDVDEISGEPEMRSGEYFCAPYSQN